MTTLQWMHPEWAVSLLWMLGLVAVALVAAAIRNTRRHRRLLPGVRPPARSWLTRDGLMWLSLAAIALAIVGPRMGERLVRVPATGVDVVLLLDLSRSMDAADVSPSRLARARRSARGLLERLDASDRVALAAFADVGVLLTPLTPDRAALAEILSGLEIGLIVPPDSKTEAGLHVAFDAFEEGSERPRVLVMLSDGEGASAEGAAIDAAYEAARRDVRIVSLAFGTAVGAQLLDHGQPFVDRMGRTVVTRRETQGLEELASATDGALFMADEWGEVDLDAATAEVRRDGAVEGGAFVERRVKTVQFIPFVLVAWVLLAMEALPRPRRVQAPQLAFVLALLAAWPAPAGDEMAEGLRSLEAEVRGSDGAPAPLVALGAARLERGQRAAAMRAFLAAAVHAEDQEVASRAYFNLGVAQLEDKDLVSARDAFFDALALDPNDEVTRFNLEWTLQALAQRGEEEQAKRPEAAPEPEPDRPPPVPPPVAPPEVDETEAKQSELVPRELTESEQQRWLERVADDPAAMARAAVAAQNPPRRGRGVPAW